MLPKPSILMLQDQEPESFAEVFAEAFRSLSRDVVAQIPRILAALLVFLFFFALALILRRVLLKVLQRVRMAPRIRILVARLALILTLVLGGTVSLVIAAEASLGRVITGFGLLSVALGFALKNPLENMVSGVLTILTGSFRIGDEIEVGGYAGVVEAINIHDTVLRTFDGKRVAIPNRDVYISAVADQTAYPLRRYDVTVGVHYDDDLVKAREVALDTLESLSGVRSSPEPEVLVSELGESSVNLILRFWSDPTQRDANHITSVVTAETKQALDAAGITIPFPIRTLQLPNGVNGLEADR